MANKNSNLNSAKVAKNDEFYTRLTDVEKECKHYRGLFRGKVIYCNCDDARDSKFFKYFSMNFEFFGLKKLITTGYKEDGHGVALIYEGDKNGNKIVDDEEIQVIELEGNGDFRSPECVEFLKEADIVVTNPPFSLFREYMKQLMEYGKKFLVICSQNAITYKEIFPYIKNNELWLGVNMVKEFVTPLKEVINEKTQYKNEQGEVIQKFGNICWYTNLPHKKRNLPLDLYKKYNAEEFPKYDNYDAIEVSKVCDIPMDYEGVLGVPITFLDKYCPEQFEILGMCENEDLYNLKTKVYTTQERKDAYEAIFGKKGMYDLNASGVVFRNNRYEKVYQRILIRHKK